MGDAKDFAYMAAAAAIGVIVAGAVMYALRDVQVVGYARNGFDV